MAKFKRQLRGAAESGGRVKGQAAGLLTPSPDPPLSFNFVHLDTAQAQSFQQWNDAGLLVEMLERMRNLSSMSFRALCADRNHAFSVYDEFPNRSDFKHPRHVPEDATWARFHVKGKPIVAGHLVDAVFYVVFLDSEHRFYLTEKRNT